MNAPFPFLGAVRSEACWRVSGRASIGWVSRGGDERFLLTPVRLSSLPLGAWPLFGIAGLEDDTAGRPTPESKQTPRRLYTRMSGDGVPNPQEVTPNVGPQE